MRRLNNRKFFFAFLLLSAVCLTNTFAAEQPDTAEKMQDSIVYLDISYYGYEQYQPWRNANLTKGWGIGCAVSKNKVITTAYNVANAAAIEVKRFGQNEFVSAKILTIDYECNLALIELDTEKLKKPLTGLKFNAKYSKGAEVDFYWLSATEQIYSGRGYLDRPAAALGSVPFSRTLHLIAANTSDKTGKGQLYLTDDKPLGIAGWSNNNKECGIIAPEVINRFLADSKKGKYKGIGYLGFAATKLLDPAMRKYLKMPADIQNGIYITSTYSIGTGSDVLQKGDVILSIDNFELNAYGKFVHPDYDTMYFEYLITSKTAGDKIKFEIFRDGKKQTVKTTAKNFDVSEMLVPWYEIDRQPEFFITGGCILQKLTRSYLAGRGKDWTGKVDSHIYNYLLNQAFKPTETRKEIVVLSYVLPGDINLGYHRLSQLVVDNINGMKIQSIADVPKALALNPEAKYNVIEFEADQPKIVLDRAKLPTADMIIAQTYGIGKLVNISAD